MKKKQAFTLEKLENVENVLCGLLVRLVKGLLRRFFFVIFLPWLLKVSKSQKHFLPDQ